MGKTEIDLIAQKNDVIVIIEVKARASDNDEAVDAMTRDKRKRMVRAADSFIKNLKGDYEYRFDVAACSGDKNNFKMEILEDAFLAADLF